jgi:mono/diheme cytochrome c family protein
MFDNDDHPLRAVKDEGRDVVQFPDRIKPSERDKLAEALQQLFGSPADPYVDGITAETRGILKLRDAIVEKGARLYRLHCLHCHGLSGDGRGPTAPWVNPHPRDYRRGIFKFTSSKQDEGVRKPRRADLVRTVREGIEGTSMPSFKLLPDDDVEALVSYVIHLSLRGETEFLVMKEILKPKHGIKNIAKEAKDLLKVLANERWVEAEQNVIAPLDQDYPYRTTTGKLIQPRGSGYTDTDQARLAESVQNGQRLFKERGCIGCHYDYGRQNHFLFDAWGTIVRPANLTVGVYRGGRRPIDLYYRIHSGINGAGMPLVATEQAGDKGRKDQDKVLWDIVNFVQVLPYAEMRKKYEIAID